MKKNLLLLFILFALSFRVQSQSISGDWNGHIIVQGMRLRMNLNILEQDTGLIGTLDIIDQGIYGIKLKNTAFKNDILSFSSTMQLDYEGKMTEADTIRGNITIRKNDEYPLVFKRGKFILNRPQEPKGPFPYQIEDVSFANPLAEGITLAGTITIPEGKGPFPIAVMISGSGPNNRDEEILTHKPFWVIADHLARNGIAVLRYDDRGCFKSTGNFGTATGIDLAYDAGAAVRYLASRKDLPIGKIGIIGHSEGGELAPQVAHDNPEVSFIVSLAGPGMPGHELLLEQSKLIMLSEGSNQDEVERAVELNRKIYAIVMKDASTKKIKKKVEKAYIKYNEDAEKNGFETFPAANLKQQISLVTSPWFRHFLRYDPSIYWSKTTVPVLALNGMEDIQVAGESNLKAIKTALESAKNENFMIKGFAGMNHMFQHCQKCTFSEYAELEETFAAEVLDVMVKWILENAK